MLECLYVHTPCLMSSFSSVNSSYVFLWPHSQRMYDKIGNNVQQWCTACTVCVCMWERQRMRDCCEFERVVDFKFAHRNFWDTDHILCYKCAFFSPHWLWENINAIKTWLTDKVLSSLAWIILGRESLLYKHIHTRSTCSHCFIKHLGSISHFKNIGNSTTSVGQCCVCLLDSSSPIGGTLNCWCSSACSWYRATADETRDKSWHPDIEPLLCREWLYTMWMCVSELEGVEVMVRSVTHQLWQINKGTHTCTQNVIFAFILEKQYL